MRCLECGADMKPVRCPEVLDDPPFQDFECACGAYLCDYDQLFWPKKGVEPLPFKGGAMIPEGLEGL